MLVQLHYKVRLPLYPMTTVEMSSWPMVTGIHSPITILFNRQLQTQFSTRGKLATDNDGYRLFTEDLGAVSPVLVGDRHFLYASAFTEMVEDSILVSLLSRHDSANYDWDQSAPQLHSEEAVVLAHMGPNSENPIALAVGKPLTIMERRVALRALFAKKHRRQRSNETPIISPAIE